MSQERFEKVRRKAPQIVFAAIVIGIAVIVILDILEDYSVVGNPVEVGPVQWIWGAVLLITRNVTDAVASWGYIGILVLMFLESTSLPIPSEVVLPFAGYLVSTGELDFWACLGIATIAGIAGCLIDYIIGLKGADAMAEHKIFGKSLFTRSQLDIAMKWFTKYGSFAVFFSRLIPGFRTVVSFPAGAVRMSLAKFVAYTSAGCFVWSGVLIYIGLFLGQNWSEVAGTLHYLIIAVAVAVVIAVVVLVVRWRRRLRSSLDQSSKT
ncbi:MAG TPA: DedA family protein [Candidatus Acidoferrales bacterium]|nr:DedA family protein [Candidatus Acidoferrales bacterium]